MEDLMKMVGGALTPEMMGQMSGMLGEDKANVQKGIGAALPQLMRGVAQTGASPQGAQDLLGMMQGGAGEPSPMDMMGNLAGIMGNQEQSNGMMQMGMKMLPMLMGNKASGMAGILGAATGMSKGSSSNMMAMLAPMIMGMMGNQMKSSGGGMNPAALMGMLGGGGGNKASNMASLAGTAMRMFG